MTLEIVRHRLHNQLLSQTKLTASNQVVAWLGAIQAQDYAGAKWAIAQRTKGLTDAAIDKDLVKIPDHENCDRICANG